MIREILEECNNDNVIKADGFDKAVIGVSYDNIEIPRLIYSAKKCISILQEGGELNEFEANEYFSYNIAGGDMGEATPIWCWDNFE